MVDDGSTDGTDEVLATYVEKDSRFIYLHRAVDPKGASHCRNIGLDKAHGEYCIFLDSDDLLLTFCLEQRIQSLHKKSIDFDFYVFSMVVQVNDTLQYNPIPCVKSYLDEFLKNRIPWGTACTLWSIAFIRELGGFNINYPRLNDPEIHIRAILNSKKGFQVYRELKADSIYRILNTISDKALFSRKYANSLLLFVQDISENLNDAGLSEKIHLKTGYLSEYFLNYAFYNTRLNNDKVLRAFYRNGVISFSNFIKLFFIYYLKVLTLKIDFVIGKKFNRNFRTI